MEATITKTQVLAMQGMLAIGLLLFLFIGFVYVLMVMRRHHDY